MLPCCCVCDSRSSACCQSELCGLWCDADAVLSFVGVFFTAVEEKLKQVKRCLLVSSGHVTPPSLGSELETRQAPVCSSAVILRLYVQP